MTPQATREAEAAIATVAEGSVVAVVDDRARRAFLVASTDAITTAGLTLMRGGRGRAMTMVAPVGADELAEHERAALALVELAGLRPLAVVCPVPFGVVRDATLARIPTVALTALLDHRARASIERVVEALLPTPHGTYVATGYRSPDGREHMAIVKGDVAGAHGVLVAVCPQCTAGHVLRSARCRCAEHVAAAMQQLARREHAILVHLGREPGARLDLALETTEAACAVRRRLGTDDRIARAIVADLAPASTREFGADPVLGDPPSDDVDLYLCA